MQPGRKRDSMMIPEYKERLDRWIDDHRDDLIADIEKLVRIDSARQDAAEGMPFGEGAARAVACMEALMKTYGLETRNYENYCIAGDLRGSEDGRVLDILAHLDVVPVSEDWKQTQPFEPAVKGDRIYGRGTSDDKGPAVAALYAIRAVKELGIPLRKGVRLLCGSDEECGSSDLEYYYGIEQESEYTFSPDADYPLINIEKGRLAKTFTGRVPKSSVIRSIRAGSKANVVPGRAEAVFTGIAVEELQTAGKTAEAKSGAVITFKKQTDSSVFCEVKGRTGHAAYPGNGINALTSLMALISALPERIHRGGDPVFSLAEMFPYGDYHGRALGVDYCDEESGELTMSFTMLTVENGTLEGTFDCRAPLCADDENLTEKLRSLFAQNGMVMEGGNMTGPHYVSAGSRIVKTLLESYELYTGKKEKPIAIGGGTYVHELERGVAFGCAVEGVDNRMHGDDEFAEIPVLVMSAKIFADAIIRLCS